MPPSCAGWGASAGRAALFLPNVIALNPAARTVSLSPSEQTMRILVVEDDAKIASFVVNGLKQNGFAVDRTADGEHGLLLASTTAYDAAVVDVMLPKLDGLARVQALIRRATNASEPTRLTVGDVTLDLLSREVTRRGERIELQAREFALLEYLMRHAGRVVTKTMILEHIWDYSFDPQTNVVDVLV